MVTGTPPCAHPDPSPCSPGSLPDHQWLQDPAFKRSVEARPGESAPALIKRYRAGMIRRTEPDPGRQVENNKYGATLAVEQQGTKADGCRKSLHDVPLPEFRQIFSPKPPMFQKPVFDCFARLWPVGAVGAALLAVAHAAEPRLWVNLEGSTLTAELLKDDGQQVELKDSQGKILKLPRKVLSFGDLNYLASLAPAPATAKTPATPALKVPLPARQMKFDPKTIRKNTGRIQLGKVTLALCETPHFLLLYSLQLDPGDVAELAERLWHDHAFFQTGFAPLFKEERHAIILAESSHDHDELAHWYMGTRGIKDPADIKEWVAAWERGSSRPLTMPNEMASERHLMRDFLLLDVAAKKGAGGADLKGVWDGYLTHVLARHLLQLLAGWQPAYPTVGTFPLFEGHAFYKEISLTGDTGTSMVQLDSGKKQSSQQGYASGKNWAADLKRDIRSGQAKPNLVVLFGNSTNDADPSDLAMAYSFSRFVQSGQPRLAGLSKLMEAVRTSKAIPDPDGTAPFFEYANGAAMQQAWVEWMSSSAFQ